MGRVDRWRYCPRCAAELEHSHERVSCPACGFVSHSNSETTVGALVVDSAGRLLLVRRAHDPYGGTWDVPGGFLEEAEHPLDALRRELQEETGLEVEPDEFVTVALDRYGDGPDAATTLNLYWSARVTGGEPVAGDDASELRWFPLDELPPDEEIGFPNVREVLREWRDRRR
ncbi:MAG TPA: NUDIX domain-containing protein [Gaiellaceae bacterium]|nr:NUDIX domain-containing protein [Gaiellaceae bacterium]